MAKRKTTKTDKPDLKRKYDSEDSKKRLLRAAIDVFSKEGYDAATTKKIAKHAGVNESLIHRYFKSKEGLFFAIVEQFHRHTVVSPSYPLGSNLEEEIRNFMQFRMDFARKEKKFLRLGITRAIIDPKVRKEWVMLAENGTHGLVARLEKLRAAGKLKGDVNLQQLSMLITGITFSMTMFTEVVFSFDRKMAEDVLKLGTEILSQHLGKSPD